MAERLTKRQVAQRNRRAREGKDRMKDSPASKIMAIDPTPPLPPMRARDNAPAREMSSQIRFLLGNNVYEVDWPTEWPIPRTNGTESLVLPDGSEARPSWITFDLQRRQLVIVLK